MKLRILSSGGYVIHIDVCSNISLECVEATHKLYYTLKKELSGKIKELVSGIVSLALFYDPREISSNDLIKKVNELWEWSQSVELSHIYKPRNFVILVSYGGDFGPDLPSVAAWAGLREEEVITIHTSINYRCYTIGFTPGFIYLGEVDSRIAAPRLETPRIKIPAGSVGIAGKMTGVYGIEGPGGWRLIGRTPLTMFDYRRNPPTPIAPGDLISFKSIPLEKFKSFEGIFVGDYRG
ncbi:MAG: 5-oxoprolinase subunit PxpB [Desulfurococcaceae archaeon TW002]